MSIEQISTKTIGKEPECSFCQAGSMISFNWRYAQDSQNSDLPKNKGIYINPVTLKAGTLLECKNCGAYWYLDAKELFMNHVESNKLDAIHSWSDSNQTLSPIQIEALDRIGSTPPDLYGNGSQFQETPCQIKTKSGELLEMAMVSVQAHAPFEHWRKYRLASDIEAISPSIYALPLEVRTATSQASEIRMGFAPTLVQLSNGEKAILNWTQSFLKKTGVIASKTTLCNESVNTANMPAIYQLQEKVVYFVADPFGSGEDS